MSHTTLTTDSGAGNQARRCRARQESLSRRAFAVRNGLGRRRSIRLGLPPAALALACGCAGPRGAVSIDPGAVGTAAAVPVWVASARAPVRAGRLRLLGVVSFARFVISAPPEREPGSVTFPGRVVDSRIEFVTLEAARLRDGEAFVAAIDSDLGGNRHDEAIAFVHGYNNTFAEGALPTGAARPGFRAARDIGKLRLAVGGGVEWLCLRQGERRLRHGGAVAHSRSRSQRLCIERGVRVPLKKGVPGFRSIGGGPAAVDWH